MTAKDWIADADRLAPWHEATVVVAGFGASGFAAADGLMALGAGSIIVLDSSDSPANREKADLLRRLDVDVRLGEGVTDVLPEGVDLVVTSPGWAPTAPLLAQGVEKLYYAIVEGELPLGPGVIDAPIGRQGESIIGRCVTPDGKPSRTEYTILKAQNGLSLAACVPVTGRTHQIRVHFASIGHPLAGDDLYGGHRDRIARQALHCARQSFRVPAYTEVPGGIRLETPVEEHARTVAVESPLPEDMRALLDAEI